MSRKDSIKEQIRRNLVALISLVVAITSLSYSTWRNEASEDNRTQRLVAIEVLLKLADLQRLTWHHHYDRDFEDKGNLRTGWAMVISIRDIATILDEPLPESSRLLWQVWDDNYQQLGDSVEAKDNVIEAIERCRQDTLELLQSLD